MGRIGRAILREYWDSLGRGNSLGCEIVAVNNPGNPEVYAHLLEYDSVHRGYRFQVGYNRDTGRIVEKRRWERVGF